jgi:predicted nuclease of restriction endonuclease-like (RecB) superfamily
MNFTELISQIETIHTELQQHAVQQVGFSLTLRNYLIGYYIVEYELNGSDRAEYGADTMKKLAHSLKHLKGTSAPRLYTFREFYLTYPNILSALSRIFNESPNRLAPILSAVPIKFDSDEQSKVGIEPEVLLKKLSFTHFLELIRIKDETKRAFYEIQIIKNNWGTRELERAINTMLYERTGLSKHKLPLLENLKNDTLVVHDIIRNPFFLEFLNLEEKPSYSESDLETALISHLQGFLTELGRGFCFEARQKRITFDNKHYRIDLVFYHRILKCHVLIDLKIGSFDHADAGQMNLYLNYYAKEEKTEGDNPPIGIILCADKNDTLVEYTTTGLSHDVLVSKYLVQLPSKQELEAFISAEMARLEER